MINKKKIIYNIYIYYIYNMSNIIKTPADIQKEYRERKKKENPEYLLLQNEKKRLYRQRKKEEKQVNINKDDNLKKYFEDMKTPKGNKYTDITIKNYVSKINKILKLLGKDKFNINYFENPDDVLKTLKESKIKNLKDYMTPIVLLLKQFKKSEDVISKYHGVMSKEKEREDEDRGNNKLNKEDKHKFLSMDEINFRIDEYDIFNDKGDIIPDKILNKLIVSFYFKNTENLIPRNDLNIIKLISVNKIKNMNEDFNYISFKDEDPKNIYLNNYKTKATYGKKKFAISKYLSDMISIYLEIYKKENGDFLFTNDKKEPYEKTAFLRIINKAMMDVLDKPISIDLVRSIVITDYYKTPRSINDKKQFHNNILLHTAKVGEEYNIVE
jgi:hypothetical protein